MLKNSQIFLYKIFDYIFITKYHQFSSYSGYYNQTES